MAKATAKAILSIKDYKKAGKDLNTILAADDDGNPAIPVKGTEDEIKAKLIEAIQFVTPEDKLKKPTCVVLEALAAEVADAPEKEEVPAPTPRPTAAQIQKMNKKDLEQLCDDLELETDPDDYEKVKDLKAAMIAEMFSESAETDPADIGETGNEKATDPKSETVPPAPEKNKKKPAEAPVKGKTAGKKKESGPKDFSKTHYGCAGDIIKENAGESIKIVKLVEMINTAHKKISGRDTSLDNTRRMTNEVVQFCVQVNLATTDGITLNIL